MKLLSLFIMARVRTTKESAMRNRQEILQWALNLLDHHYIHQADSSPPTAITVETEDMVKLVLFLTTDGFSINRSFSDER